MGARVVGMWVGEQKPLGKTPQRGNPSPESTYLPTLHPAKPDWWPATKRPWAIPGGQIAASVTNGSHGEDVPPCLRTSPPLGATLGFHRTSCCIPFPRHASGVVLVLGFRGALVSHAPLRVPKQRRL